MGRSVNCIARLIDFINTQTSSQIDLLAQLVNINSGTTNSEGISQVGELLRNQFQQLGFTTQWYEQPANMDRAGTLVAQRHGNKGKRLLLIGHLDTVFSKQGSFQFFKRQGEQATGPGVIDDKGGVVVILYALKALDKIHALKDATITVVLTGDEEDSGKPTSISRKPLVEAAKQSDIALDFEWAITQDTATIARRGISSWILKTEGVETHSSQIFQQQAGDGAIFELARILSGMHDQLSNERYLSFNPGLILGGTKLEEHEDSSGEASGKSNIIAKTGYTNGDLRYLSEEQRHHAEREIITIVNKHLPNTKASITFQQAIPSMPPSAANLALLNQYSKVSESLGYNKVHPLDPGLRGAGDISHIASLVSGSLAGLGPVGTNAHSEKETIDLKSLPIQTQRAALLIYQLIN